MSKQSTGGSRRYPLAVRILALVMSLLVASGAVVYLVSILLELFGL